MYKKAAIALAVTLALAWAAHIIAQENKEESKTETVKPADEPQRPAAGRVFGERFDNWLNELTEAYEQNNREKMGQLIGQMKQSRQGEPRGFGPRGEGPRGEGPQGRGMGRPDEDRQSGRENSPLAKNDVEKKILNVLEDMYQNQSRGMMNVPPEDGRVLRLLTETAGAKHVVEIGTSNGYSGIWFSMALQKTGGKLTTYEINQDRAAQARENFKRAGVDKIVTLIEGDAHETITRIKEPIDILFLDADKEGYGDYLEKLMPLVKPGGLILAHNTSMRGPMGDYIKAITTNADLETIFLHEQGAGLGVTLKKR